MHTVSRSHYLLLRVLQKKPHRLCLLRNSQLYPQRRQLQRSHPYLVHHFPELILYLQRPTLFHCDLLLPNLKLRSYKFHLTPPIAVSSSAGGPAPVTPTQEVDVTVYATVQQPAPLPEDIDTDSRSGPTTRVEFEVIAKVSRPPPHKSKSLVPGIFHNHSTGPLPDRKAPFLRAQHYGECSISEEASTQAPHVMTNDDITNSMPGAGDVHFLTQPES